jgi:hypothetical protein
MVKDVLNKLFLASFSVLLTANVIAQKVGINANGGAPEQLLHLDAPADGEGMKITNPTSGNAATDGVDLIQSGLEFEINQLENAPIRISTNGSERMTILGNGNIGIGSESPGTALDVSGEIRTDGGTTYDGGTLYRYENLATYSASNGVTGAMKVTLPRSWSNTMMSVTIKGYNYSGIGSWEVVVGGYNYTGSGGSWYNESATITGSAPFSQVRLGHEGSNCVILLGDVTTTWSYPKAQVVEMIAGHQNYSSGWGSGWSIGMTTNIGGITISGNPTPTGTGGTAGGDISGPFSNLQINSGVVGAAEIATDAVRAAEIQANAVGASEIAADAVRASEIQANAVGNSEMNDNAIGSAEIIDASIANGDLNTGVGGIYKGSGSLAGSIAGATVVTLGANNLDFNMNSTGDVRYMDGATTRMIVQDNGRLGINRTSASYNLDVTGNGRFTTDLMVQGSDVYDNSGPMRLSGEDNVNITMDYNNNDADSRSIIFGKNSMTAPTELMRLTEAGNLGIGNTGASYKLEVTGTAHVDALNVNGAYSLPTAAGGTGVFLRGDGSWQSVPGDGTGTDDQTIDVLSLSGTTLNLSLEGDGEANQTVNLASLQDGTGTDDQNISGSGLSGTNLTIGIEGGSNQVVNLASLQDGTGTDDQTIDVLSLSGTTLNLSLEGDGEANQTVNLSSLQDGYIGDAGTHTAGGNLNMNNREIDAINYLDIRAAEGYGLRFWGSSSYAINMGTAAEFNYGGVTGYSIKNNMSNTAGRGWTWGVDGLTPVASINTAGRMQIADYFSPLGGMHVGGTSDPGTDNLLVDGTTTLSGLSGAGNRMVIANASGVLSTQAIPSSTDDQNISGSGLSGTNLTIGIEGGSNQVVNLASLQDGTGTDDQTIDVLSLSGTTLNISLEGDGEANQTVNLSALEDDLGNHTATTTLNLNNQSISNVNQLSMRGVASYDKLRVWNSNLYTIGMVASNTYGYLNNDYAMTFTMNNDADRGWLWRDVSDATSDGAMSLTTGGNMYVKGIGNVNQAVIRNLAGGGNRMVVTDNSGNISAQAIPSGGSGDITAVNTNAPITGGATSGAVTLGISTGGITGTHIASNTIPNGDLQAGVGGIFKGSGSIPSTVAITTGNFDVNFDANTLVVDGSANEVGIGTSNPTGKLEVYQLGQAEVNVTAASGTSDALISFRNGTTDEWSIGFDDSDGDRFKISRSGLLGSNDAFEISSTNTITMLSLAGSGTRRVVADGSGNLSTQNITSEISICEFLLSEAVSNGGQEVGFVVPSNLNGKTLVAGVAKGMTGAGTCSVRVRRNGSIVGTITNVGTTHRTGTGWSTAIATGDLITVETLSVSGTLNGLTVTVSAQ